LTEAEIARMSVEEAQEFITLITPERGQQLLNGGGGSLEPDRAVPEALEPQPKTDHGGSPVTEPPRHPPEAPQSNSDSPEVQGFIPRELVPTRAAQAAATSMADITAQRLQLRRNGFHPIPLEGKSPRMKGWEQKFDVSEEEIRRWEKTYPRARNTGVLAKFAPGFDIDITIEAAAKAAEDKAREFLEEQEHTNIHVRFGAPPKRLIPLRT